MGVKGQEAGNKRRGNRKEGEPTHSLFFHGNELLSHVEKVWREVVVFLEKYHMAIEILSGSYSIKHHV